MYTFMNFNEFYEKVIVQSKIAKTRRIVPP